MGVEQLPCKLTTDNSTVRSLWIQTSNNTSSLHPLSDKMSSPIKVTVHSQRHMAETFSICSVQPIWRERISTSRTCTAKLLLNCKGRDEYWERSSSCLLSVNRMNTSSWMSRPKCTLLGKRTQATRGILRKNLKAITLCEWCDAQMRS